jgi:hypothetical protein
MALATLRDVDTSTVGSDWRADRLAHVFSDFDASESPSLQEADSSEEPTLANIAWHMTTQSVSRALTGTHGSGEVRHSLLQASGFYGRGWKDAFFFETQMVMQDPVLLRTIRESRKAIERGNVYDEEEANEMIGW